MEECGVNNENGSVRRFGIRHVQVVMMFFAMAIGFSVRVSTSIGVVAMVDSSSDNHFDWSVKIQSLILSSFSWGYIILQIPAGEIAGRFGGKFTLTMCIAMNSLGSLLIPFAAYYAGWKGVCACRIVQGLFQGFLLPSNHHLMAKWAPLSERSRFGMFVYSGAQFGTGMQFLISGFVAEYWGWAAIYYLTGTIGLVWTALYLLVGADSPQSSKLISKEERLYIEKSLGFVKEKKKYETPWKSILMSLPFISIVVAHICQAWGLWTFMTEIPSYMSQVLGVNIKQNGILSAIPYLVMCVISFPFGFFSDYVLKRKLMTLTMARKVSNSIGFFGPAIALIFLSYVPADLILAVLLLSLTVSINVGYITGFFLVHIDMAPNFAGTMMGITNGVANVVSIFAPIVAGAILKDETDQSQWHKVFFITAAMYIFGNIFYLIFGTSKRQIWNEPDDITTVNKTNETAPEKNNVQNLAVTHL